MKEKLKKLNDNKFELPKEGNMKVPAQIFVSEKLLEGIEEKSIQQLVNVATLPGLHKAAIAMPDMHMGYGFPIGGVAAFDFEEGIITPGGIGFDINCGVRMLTTTLTADQVREKLKELIDKIFEKIPAGVGSKSKIRLDDTELNKVLDKGTAWAVENGYGNDEDFQHCEENGSMSAADSSKISDMAKKRGRNQLGTLGAGNHFLEIQRVDEIYEPEIAEAYGIKNKDQVTVMIHCGSRGLGHQVCSDYLRKMNDAFPEIVKNIPDRDLVYAPAKSQLAKDYLGAMSAAANYAWCNRHIIAHYVREAFNEVFGIKAEDMKTVYDVCHNIAKVEEHMIDGKMTKVIMHRKGATRCFPASRPETPKAYAKVGHPVIIPGSMGTSSYVLVGTEKAMEESFGSTAHGAGRVMSRHAALDKFKGEKVKEDLAKSNILVKAASWKGIAEEAPLVYKDIDEVIKASAGAGLAIPVVRVKPMGVIKG